MFKLGDKVISEKYGVGFVNIIHTYKGFSVCFDTKGIVREFDRRGRYWGRPNDFEASVGFVSKAPTISVPEDKTIKFLLVAANAYLLLITILLIYIVDKLS